MKTIKILPLIIILVIGYVGCKDDIIQEDTEPKSPSFDRNSSWSIITTNVFDETFYRIDTYKITEDTLINNKNYLKILIDDDFCVALRETDDNKIYVYIPSLERELLIYDFDWYPNKTLYCQTSYEDNVVQAVLGNSIDSIQLLDGKYYKCWGSYMGIPTIIRGIGHTAGFFIQTFDLPTNGNQYALLCFYIDDILVYRNPKFDHFNANSIDLVTSNKK